MVLTEGIRTRPNYFFFPPLNDTKVAGDDNCGLRLALSLLRRYTKVTSAGRIWDSTQTCRHKYLDRKRNLDWGEAGVLTGVERRIVRANARFGVDRVLCRGNLRVKPGFSLRLKRGGKDLRSFDGICCSARRELFDGPSGEIKWRVPVKATGVASKSSGH